MRWTKGLIIGQFNYIHSLFFFFFLYSLSYLYVIFLPPLYNKKGFRFQRRGLLVAVKCGKVGSPTKIIQRVNVTFLQDNTIYMTSVTFCPMSNNSLLLSHWIVSPTSVRKCVEIKLHLGIKSRRDLCKMPLFCF